MPLPRFLNFLNFINFSLGKGVVFTPRVKTLTHTNQTFNSEDIEVYNDYKVQNLAVQMILIPILSFWLLKQWNYLYVILYLSKCFFFILQFHLFLFSHVYHLPLSCLFLFLYFGALLLIFLWHRIFWKSLLPPPHVRVSIYLN